MAKEIRFQDPEKTYVTKRRMYSALNKYPWLADAEYLVAQTDDGRYYPIFLASRLPKGVNIGSIPHIGYCVVN